MTVFQGQDVFLKNIKFDLFYNMEKLFEDVNWYCITKRKCHDIHDSKINVKNGFIFKVQGKMY